MKRRSTTTLGALVSATADTIVSSTLTIDTTGAGFVDLTADIAAFVADARARDGILTAFSRHTSASLTIQENADPTVLQDLMGSLDRFAPQGAQWAHDTEGPDDMPAHVKTMLTATSLQIPVHDRLLALGTWQAIYLIEHRSRPHRRDVVLQFHRCRCDISQPTRYRACGKSAASRLASRFEPD